MKKANRKSLNMERSKVGMKERCPKDTDLLYPRAATHQAVDEIPNKPNTVTLLI